MLCVEKRILSSGLFGTYGSDGPMNQTFSDRRGLLELACFFTIIHFLLTVICALYYVVASFQGLRGGWKPSTVESGAFWMAAVLSFPLGIVGLANPFAGLICVPLNSILWGIGFFQTLKRLDGWLRKINCLDQPLVFPPISDRYRPDLDEKADIESSVGEARK